MVLLQWIGLLPASEFAQMRVISEGITITGGAGGGCGRRRLSSNPVLLSRGVLNRG